MSVLDAPFPWFGVPDNVADKIRLGAEWGDRGPCWEWTAAKTGGYGVVQFNGRVQRAHRVVYEALIAKIPDHLESDHLCRNRSCVNPRHIEPVTSVVNNARSDSASAKHARQTHCHRGHQFTEANTYLRKRGHKTERFCRECMRERDRERYRKKKGGERDAHT